MSRNRVVRRSFSGRRFPGRLTEWFGDPFATSETALAASTFQIISSLSAAGLAKRPFTITRTVGTLMVASDQTAAGEFPSGAIGGMVVSEKASTTGATAIPDPVTEASSDEWYMYESWALKQRATPNDGSFLIRHFDSRAQRKVQDGEDFVFVIANASAADGCVFTFMVRTLVKLS